MNLRIVLQTCVTNLCLTDIQIDISTCKTHRCIYTCATVMSSASDELNNKLIPPDDGIKVENCRKFKN